MTRRNRLTPIEVRERQRASAGILTEPEVALIKWMQIHERADDRALAEAYQMSLWAIRAIRRGDTWNWVEPVDNRRFAKQPELSPELQAESKAAQERIMALARAGAFPAGVVTGLDPVEIVETGKMPETTALDESARLADERLAAMLSNGALPVSPLTRLLNETNQELAKREKTESQLSSLLNLGTDK